MSSTLRIFLAVLSGLAGLFALFLIQKPDTLPHEKAMELAAVTLLLATTLLGTAAD